MEVNNLNQKLKAAVIIVAVAAAICVGVVVAAYVWNQSVSWTVENESFSVDQATTLDLGVVPVGYVATETYTIQNTGNVQITVLASHSFTGATVSWDKTSATLAVGASTTFTATITVTGAGSGTVTFTC